MLHTVAKLHVPYIMMHMRGTSQNMQQKTDYDDVIKEVLSFFSERLVATKSLGIKDIIIDPGFGFAKNLEQNYKLLNQMEVMSIIEHPLLAGISRKSMIYKTLGNTAEQALNGTTALHMVCLQKGAKILRVHDVKEAMECVKLYEQLIA
jgi:dihydropteroate synthase